MSNMDHSALSESLLSVTRIKAGSSFFDSSPAEASAASFARSPCSFVQERHMGAKAMSTVINPRGLSLPRRILPQRSTTSQHVQTMTIILGFAGLCQVRVPMPSQNMMVRRIDQQLSFSCTIYKRTPSVTQVQVLVLQHKPTDSDIKLTSDIYKAKWAANCNAH